MWFKRVNDDHMSLSFLIQKLWIFLCYPVFTASAQCEYGLDSGCVWTHDPNTGLYWKLKRDSGDSFVELSECNHPDCTTAIIESPWLPARENEISTTLNYKIYGTSAVYFRLNLKMEDSSIHQIFSKNGYYAYGYPDSWTSVNIQIPSTHTRYKLILKAFVPYHEAMIAVKDINLDGRIITSSTGTSSSSASTKTITTITKRTTSTTTTTTTTTTTVATPENEEEVSPTHYIPDSDDNVPETPDDYDNFIDEEDEEEEKERFQTLAVKNFMGERDLTKGYTAVVEPQICMYK